MSREMPPMEPTKLNAKNKIRYKKLSAVIRTRMG
jgi:hypothetical protein